MTHKASTVITRIYRAGQRFFDHVFRLTASAISIVSLILFFVSAYAHVCGFFGIDEPLGMSPWPLNLGIVLVWIPALFVTFSLMDSGKKSGVTIPH